MPFDPIGAFERRFTPTKGGYLYYPSARSGGKLVTVVEFETLASDWKRVAGMAGQLKMTGILVAVLVVWAFISTAFSLPEWPNWIVIAGGAAAMIGRMFRVSLAPNRLVRDRPAISPPRPMSQVQQEARALVDWRLVGFFLLLSGIVFFGSLAKPQNTFWWWAWTIGSGLYFVSLLWIAARKFWERNLNTRR